MRSQLETRRYHVECLSNVFMEILFERKKEVREIQLLKKGHVYQESREEELFDSIYRKLSSRQMVPTLRDLFLLSFHMEEIGLERQEYPRFSRLEHLNLRGKLLWLFFLASKKGDQRLVFQTNPQLMKRFFPESFSSVAKFFKKR